MVEKCREVLEESEPPPLQKPLVQIIRNALGAMVYATINFMRSEWLPNSA